MQKEAHLLELSRYVARNPVRAGMVKRPGMTRQRYAQFVFERVKVDSPRKCLQT